MAIIVQSDAFKDGEPIPVKYSQDGENVSPPLRFASIPDQSQALVLIADDPDAPMKEPYVHWVMYAIPSRLNALPEGIDGSPRPDRADGALQGRNSAGNVGYDGPAPPKGHGTHHYHFKVYALDETVRIPSEAEKKAVLQAIRGHILDEGELVGTYER